MRSIKENFRNKKYKLILITLTILLLLIATVIGVGITNAAGDTTEIAKSITFTENMEGTYVYVRAVDKAGNKGAWSNAQQVYIDGSTPTVTAKQSSVTITEGDTELLSSYFDIVLNGTNKNYTTECTVDGKVYETTESIPVGTHTVICTVTVTGGNSSSTTMELVVEQASPASITTATNIQSATTPFIDGTGKNTVIVPGGFKVRTDLATTVDKGIVIEDSSGNQFVWVPIGTITTSTGSTVNIEFGRFAKTATPAQYASNYTSTVTINSYYQEISTYRASTFKNAEDSNATAKDLATFISNAQTNKGYYLARYEASFGSGAQISSVSDGIAGVTNQKPAFKQSTDKSDDTDIATVTSTPGMLWNYIRQGDASLACQNLYAGNEYNGQSFVESDLVNSYAWDTAIMFIQKCSDKTNYAYQTGLNSTLYNTGTDTGKTTDVACNIFDMAGNLGEWTTEYSSYSVTSGYYSCVYRGGNYYNTYFDTAGRYYNLATNSHAHIGFRAVLSCTPVS